MPVAVKVPVAGSYSSTLALIRAGKPADSPPAIKTLPFVSKVAVCPALCVVMLPVAVKMPGDCAISMEPLPATFNKTERTQMAFICHVANFTALRW